MIKFVLIVAVCAAFVAAEPPRRRFQKLRTFARQEIDETNNNNNNNGNADPAEGYQYQPPSESQRLRLPSSFNFKKFGRQETQPMNGGYSYPKPDVSYGTPLPDDDTTEPSNTYGTPATTDYNEDTSTSTDKSLGEETTTNPQAESLKSIQASQLRRKNGKFNARIIAAQQQQQQFLQPIVYVEYPESSILSVDDHIEPQYVYIFK